MEAVEEANSVAVESCHDLLTLLLSPLDGGGGKRCRELSSEAVEEAAVKFMRVSSSLLSFHGGRRRVKTGPNLATRLPRRLFLDLHVGGGGGAWKTFAGKGGVGVATRQTLPPPFKMLQFRREEGEEEGVGFCRSGINLNFEAVSSTTSRSFMSTLSIDGSVGGEAGSFQLLTQKNQRGSGRCSGGEEGGGRCKSGGGGKCHCSKKRKDRVRKSIKVPAISNKVADIPPDDYSWRKYGQKPIKGSPHPRGYYKCSGVRGCPARKHVERCVEEPSMLIVTYDGEHSHPQTTSQLAIV